MSIARPFFRTYRLFDASGSDDYVLDPRFAGDRAAVRPQHAVRAFLVLQSDLRQLFEFIEPADDNLRCYSLRIHSLLTRACIELEANMRAILLANKYKKARRPGARLTMSDYHRIETSHWLSRYEVRLPYWEGPSEIRTPFDAWRQGGKLQFYEAYNKTKHDRHGVFSHANFEASVDALAALVTVLSAQFGTEDFAEQHVLVSAGGGPPAGLKTAIGGFFQVRFPDPPRPEEAYGFSWKALKDEPSPFQEFDYDSLN